jgi:hypothetical protein
MFPQAGARVTNADSANSSNAKHCPFNGYAEQVAALYAGMDLRKYF